MSRAFFSVAFFCLFALVVAWAGCTDTSPTGGSEIAANQGLAPGTISASPAPPDLTGFTCESLEEVRVRFSDPGFVRDNQVAVYAAFFGAPPGDKFLRIYWDYVNEREEFQIVDTQEGEVRRNNDELFDIEETVTHTYENLSGTTELTVRVELVHEEGNTRLCARNRTITVSPPAGFVPPAVGTTGSAGVKSGDDWIVCRGGQKTAWVAANDGGTYDAVKACRSLGYRGVNDWGGTCGDVCGYCGDDGREFYDGAGGASPDDLSFTVHWRCTR